MTRIGRQAAQANRDGAGASAWVTTTVYRRPLLSIFFLLSVLAHGVLLAAWSADERTILALSAAPLRVQLESPGTSPVASLPLRTPKQVPRVSRRQPTRSNLAPAITAPEATNPVDSTATDDPHTQPADVQHTNSAPVQLQALLTARLAHFFEYPRLARQRGWQGQVVLRVHITGDGRLQDIRVGATSGFAVLDRSATQSLARIGDIQDATTDLPASGIDIELPVIYRLTPGS